MKEFSLLSWAFSFFSLSVSGVIFSSTAEQTTGASLALKDTYIDKRRNDSTMSYVFPTQTKESGNIPLILSKTSRIFTYPIVTENQHAQPRSHNNIPLTISESQILRNDSISGRDAAVPGTANADPTPAPVVGAIDYVLMPLIILGVAAPIFVIMYVVMGVIEFKLPPNTQLRSSATDLFSTADFAYQAFSRTLESDQCIERASCYIGTFSRSWGLQKYFLYQFLDEIIMYFLPEGQKRSLRTFLHAIRKHNVDCSTFECLQ